MFGRKCLPGGGDRRALRPQGRLRAVAHDAGGEDRPAQSVYGQRPGDGPRHRRHDQDRPNRKGAGGLHAQHPGGGADPQASGARHEVAAAHSAAVRARRHPRHADRLPRAAGRGVELRSRSHAAHGCRCGARSGGPGGALDLRPDGGHQPRRPVGAGRGGGRRGPLVRIARRPGPGRRGFRAARWRMSRR